MTIAIPVNNAEMPRNDIMQRVNRLRLLYLDTIFVTKANETLRTIIYDTAA